MFDTLRAVISFKVGPSTLSYRHSGYGRVGEADEFIRTVAFAQYGRVFYQCYKAFLQRVFGRYYTGILLRFSLSLFHKSCFEHVSIVQLTDDFRHHHDTC